MCDFFLHVGLAKSLNLAFFYYFSEAQLTTNLIPSQPYFGQLSIAIILLLPTTPFGT
jgi:hypothetical protein